MQFIEVTHCIYSARHSPTTFSLNCVHAVIIEKYLECYRGVRLPEDCAALRRPSQPLRSTLRKVASWSWICGGVSWVTSRASGDAAASTSSPLPSLLPALVVVDVTFPRCASSVVRSETRCPSASTKEAINYWKINDTVVLCVSPRVLSSAAVQCKSYAASSALVARGPSASIGRSRNSLRCDPTTCRAVIGRSWRHVLDPLLLQDWPLQLVFLVVLL